MPNIPFPNVPPYPGVPALPRSLDIPEVIQIPLGQVGTLLLNALQQQQQWGIFDAVSGAQIGVASQANSFAQSLLSQLIGPSGPTLSTVAFEFMAETRVSDFPVERGGFASYNKVQTPANPTVTLALAGSVTDRATFLNAIDSYRISTNLVNVVTPEVTYANYTIERYTYTRRAEKGATLLIVEIVLTEIRQVSAAYSTVTTPISQPQNPSATPSINGGTVQAQPPSSVLNQAIGGLFPRVTGSN